MKNLKYWWVTAGVAWLLTGSMLFWGGFHNIDYSRNFLKLAYWEDLDYEEFADRNMRGEIVDFDTVYGNGLTMSIIGFYVAIVGAVQVCYGASRK